MPSSHWVWLWAGLGTAGCLATAKHSPTPPSQHLVTFLGYRHQRFFLKVATFQGGQVKDAAGTEEGVEELPFRPRVHGLVEGRSAAKRTGCDPMHCLSKKRREE